eukprot:jgi/Antlo1/115/2525
MGHTEPPSMRKNCLAHKPLAQHFELPKIRYIPHEKKRQKRVAGISEVLAAYRSNLNCQ